MIKVVFGDTKTHVKWGCSSVFILDFEHIQQNVQHIHFVSVVLCTIWHHLYNLKNMEKHPRKSNTFSKLQKRYQILQSVSKFEQL